MLLNGEAALGGNFFLAGFNGAVIKLLDVPALQADDVVMVFAMVELEYGFPAFKVMAYQQAGMLELGEYAVNRGEADIFPAAMQDVVNIFGA